MIDLSEISKIYQLSWTINNKIHPNVVVSVKNISQLVSGIKNINDNTMNCAALDTDLAPRVCVCACVRACVRACMRTPVRKFPRIL